MRRALSGLTRRGRLFLAAGLVAAVVAVGVGQRDLLRVGILLLALPVVSLLVALRSRVRLAAARVVNPPRTPVGTPARVHLILQNLARIRPVCCWWRTRCRIALGTRPRFVLDHVWSRFRREVSYDIRADLRGRYPIGPLTVRLTDPFGLVELRRAFSETATVIITPKVHSLPRSDYWANGAEAVRAGPDRSPVPARRTPPFGLTAMATTCGAFIGGRRRITAS